VTQRNTGRRTAGIDGEVALSSQARAVVAERVHRDRSSWDPVPVRRVFIPKANGKQRPLGIPVIMDRCHQARVRNALEPEWEARFESRSYGFRPGRSCADAIGALYNALKGSRTQRVWILDADLSAAFDKIDHARLLENLGSFPARDQIRGWLKTGVVEEGMLIRTEEGTPQGGVTTPPTQWATSSSMRFWRSVGWNSPAGRGTADMSSATLEVRLFAGVPEAPIPPSDAGCGVGGCGDGQARGRDRVSLRSPRRVRAGCRLPVPGPRATGTYPLFQRCGR
jgi:hypothetical protein